jgi:hypothetical protein
MTSWRPRLQAGVFHVEEARYAGAFERLAE